MTKTEQELIKEIEEAQQKLADSKYELEELKEKEMLKEKANKMFDKQFGLNMISDDYNIYPQEEFKMIRNGFILGFSTDDTLNKFNLEQYRNDYINYLRRDIEELQEKFKEIEKQYKKLKK